MRRLFERGAKQQYLFGVSPGATSIDNKRAPPTVSVLSAVESGGRHDEGRNPAPGGDRRRRHRAGRICGSVGVAYPQAAPAASVVRAFADCAAVVTLGLAVVPMLDDGRYRGELIRRAVAPLAVAAGFWLFAELTRLVVGAAEAAAVPVIRVGLAATVEFTFATSAGRSGLFSAAAAGPVLLVALAAPRTPPGAIAAVGIAAVGLVARTITGHVSASALGAVAIAIHTLAAAMWAGRVGEDEVARVHQVRQ